jgi:hypothetical protein
MRFMRNFQLAGIFVGFELQETKGACESQSAKEAASFSL